MRRDMRILLSTACLGAAIAWGGDLPDAVTQHEAFRVDEVEVRGVRFLSPEAVRDLLDLDIDVSKYLPSDDSTSGFDNIAGALGLSSTLVEAYVPAAQKISLIEPGIGEVDIRIVKMGSGEREPPAPMEVTIANAPQSIPERAPATDAPPVEFPIPARPQAQPQPRGDWNTYELRAVGQTFWILRNGKVINQFDNGVDKASSRAGDPPTLVARAVKIRETLGWEPRHDDLTEIVATSLAWEKKLAAGHWRT